MEKDILAVLQSNLSTYSKSRHAIAMYLLSAPVQAALMTAKQLADAVGVSEATVVRFASELGYSGYPQMQRAMRAQWIAGESPIGEAEEFAQTDMLSDMRAIQKTMRSLQQKDLQAALCGISGAKRIYVFGLGSAASVAGILADALHASFRDVHKLLSSEDTTVRRELMHISKEDAVIALCTDKYQQTAELLEFCRSNGAFRVAICDERVKAIHLKCNVYFPVQCGNSLASLVSFVHMLAVALVAQNEEKTIK